MPSLIPGYEYDIFISYRQKDNKYDGWVTEFVDNLKKELEATFKEEISVYFDINPHDGLLETHDVDASLKDKLKCLIFIPIISRTYCDPKSFAWEHEFKAFIEQVSQDQYGLKVKLPDGNIANRVLPVQIHDLDADDKKIVESELGGFIRGIEFVYKEPGVNKPLTSEDDEKKNLNGTKYRIQINKVANAINEIIRGLKSAQSLLVEEKTILIEPSSEVKKDVKRLKQEIEEKTEGFSKNKHSRKLKSLTRKHWLSIPVILILLLILIPGILLINHRVKVKWALTTALPKIEQYYNELNIVAAFNLVQKAGKYIPKDPKLEEWKSQIIKNITILTDPPGADVFIKEYSDSTGKWNKAGMTPINNLDLPALTFYKVKFVKSGYEDVLAVTVTVTNLDTLQRKLFQTGTTPKGMVYVEGYLDEVTNKFKKENGFFLDRYEVTNKQYKEFVDKGGYNDQKYWKNEFNKDGKILTWKEALAQFVDKSGRPGPSTWEAGDYPEGQDDFPVSGVSWYEAAAYCEFAGKELPTGDHWETGAGFYKPVFLINSGYKILPASNFNEKGPEKTGTLRGINCFGACDMAGNVREWCWNKTNPGNLICGGGWDDKSYLYSIWSYLPSFDRSIENGFRCVQYIDRDKIPEEAFRDIIMTEGIDFSKIKPVSDDIFTIYRNQFLYDRTSLNAKIEARDESQDDWITERITFNAAYGNERVTAYLYLPKNSVPPFQTVIFFPGSTAIWEKHFLSSKYTRGEIDFIVKNGRAVICPVFDGTFERNEEGFTDDIVVPRQTHQYTEYLIRWTKDFSRTIDYLETRSDIDTNKLCFYGLSWGGMTGGIIPAVESRLKVFILNSGGFLGRAFPEADQVNYIPRIRIPFLMLNGKYDGFFPYETHVKPFFDLLGTQGKDKRICLYETGHLIPKNEVIKESLNWLDKYFGLVKPLLNK